MAEEKIQEIIEEQESYRDSLATVDETGKRIWLYPKEPKGRYTRARSIIAYVLIALLLAMPWVKFQGHPIFLFNIFEREFILFGVPFFPQDFHIFAIGLITLFVFIMLFTAVYGRVWCGWTCPQTIFMEMVFRRLEYWIEGTPVQQKRLTEGPWNGEKIRKKVSKHGLYVLFSLIISHSVMAYIVGTDSMFNIISQGPQAHLPGFIGLMAFTGAFYYVFAKLREQVCTVICPYGRLQGVLLGKDSMVVAYDHVRGEPRGKKPKEGQEALGDCIDCTACVRVCPTGIDIRNGTQLECVNCTACMDACDDIMDKLDRERGLIRITSQENIENKRKFRFTPRMAAYSVVLTILLGIMVTLLATRNDVEAHLNRVQGQLYTKMEDGETIRNLFKVNLLNKTYEDMKVDLKVAEQGGQISVVGDFPKLKSGETAEAIVFIDMPKDQLKGMKTRIELEVYSKGELIETTSTNFMGPAQ